VAELDLRVGMLGRPAVRVSTPDRSREQIRRSQRLAVWA
jgi:hypothetical protein